MKRHFQKISKHAKNTHKHLKKHGKWYFYGHMFIFSVILLVSGYQKHETLAALPICTNTFNRSNLVLDFQYKDAKSDVRLKSINLDNIVFPDLVLINKVKQIKPIPNKQEISTDRGDLANYNFINKEDPTNQEIVDYIGNNNLNNIIDGEGRGETVLDFEFSKKMYDNNAGQDTASELLIFERGMNSDIYLQVIDKLGGNTIGEKVFLSRQDSFYAGFDIDTAEIGNKQKVGYRILDLNKFNVGELQYLRLSYGKNNGGPDFKIIGLNTLKCAEKKADRLEVEAKCTDKGSEYKTREITNPNNRDVTFDRDLYNTDKKGFDTIPAFGTLELKTPIVKGKNVLRVFVDDELHFVQVANNETCPILQPDNKLILESMCSDSVNEYHTWKVINPNDEALDFDREIYEKNLSCKTKKVEICHVPPGNAENEHVICVSENAVETHLDNGDYLGECDSGDSKKGKKHISKNGEIIIKTPAYDGNQNVKISINGELHDIQKYNKNQCMQLNKNDYILNGTVDKDSLKPFEKVKYILEYENRGENWMTGAYIDLYLTDGAKIDEESLNAKKWNGKNMGDFFRVWIINTAPNQSGKIELEGEITPNVGSGLIITLHATIFGHEDKNLNNNTVNLQSKTIELKPLELTTLCSDDPSTYRSWRIKNYNDINIPIKILVNNKNEFETVAKQEDFTYIKTNTFTGDNIVELYYAGKKQDEKISDNVLCPKPFADLTVEKIQYSLGQEDKTFILKIDTSNLGPNLGSGAVLETSLSSGVFIGEDVVDNLNKKTFDIENEEQKFFQLTGYFIHGIDVNVISKIHSDVIDPNIHNNEKSIIVPIPKYDDKKNNDQIFSGDNIKTGNDTEKIHLSAGGGNSDMDFDFTHEAEKGYTGEMIGYGCKYDDEPYENIKFVDIQGHRSKDFVELLRLNCIVKGRKADYFVTEGTITKAEGIKILTKIRGIKNNLHIKGEKYIYLGDTPMSDIQNDHRAAVYVDHANQLGLLDGLYKQDGNQKLFKPTNYLTRGDAIKLLVQTYILTNGGNMESDMILPFSDQNSLGEYKDYMTFAYVRGFLDGSLDNGELKIDINRPITRSEFSKIVYKAFYDLLKIYKIQ